MVNVITESDMDFIADNTFHIEKSGCYNAIRGKEIKSVEFVRVKDGKLLLVEARSSFTNPDNTSAENLKQFQERIDEICGKFIHSLNLFSSLIIGVTEDTSASGIVMPERVSLVFVLVIKNYNLDGCRKVRIKLKSKLPPYLMEIWKPKVFVINQNTAEKRGLVVSRTNRESEEE